MKNHSDIKTEDEENEESCWNSSLEKEKSHISSTLNDAMEYKNEKKLKKGNKINFYEDEPYLDDLKGPVDYIILIIHGIGSNEEVINNQCEDLKNSFKIVKKMWFYDYPFNIHFHIFNWKKYIIDAQNHVFDRINITTMVETRKMINLAAGDIICFLHPRYGDYIMQNLYEDMYTTLESLKNHASGRFKNSKICLLGYSLGSVIAYEIINSVKVRLSESTLEYHLGNKIDYLFTLGSPLSALLSLHKPEYINRGLKLIKKLKFYNIFHGFDPVAFRVEPLIYPKVKKIPEPVLINYWRNNGARYWFEWDKNMQNAKTAIVQNFNDITSAITNSFYKFLGKSNEPREDQGTLNRNLCHEKCKSKDLKLFLLKVKENQKRIALEQQKKIRREKNKALNKKKYHTEESIKESNSEHSVSDADQEVETETEIDGNISVEEKDRVYGNKESDDSYKKEDELVSLTIKSSYSVGSNKEKKSKNEGTSIDTVRKRYVSQDSISENSFFDYKSSENDNDKTSEKAEANKNSSDYTEEKEENDETDNQTETEADLPLRYDYQLQEFIIEHYIYPLAVAKSHFNYFIIKDISLFILKELTNRKIDVSYDDYLTNIEKEYNHKALNERDITKKKKYLKIASKATKIIEEFRKYEKGYQSMSDPFNMKNFKNFI